MYSIPKTTTWSKNIYLILLYLYVAKMFYFDVAIVMNNIQVYGTYGHGTIRSGSSVVCKLSDDSHIILSMYWPILAFNSANTSVLFPLQALYHIDLGTDKVHFTA